MKKSLCFLLVCLLLLSPLAGCGREGEPERDCGAEELAAAVLAGQESYPELHAARYGDAEFAQFAPLYLGELSGRVTDGVICYPFFPSAVEVTVFRMDSPDSAKAAREPLEAYRDQQVEAFFGYAPEESALAEEGVVLIHGAFAALLICGDAQQAERDFLACFDAGAPAPGRLEDYTVTEPAPEPQQNPEQTPTPEQNPEQNPDPEQNPEQSPDPNPDPEQNPGQNPDSEQDPGQNPDPEQTPTPNPGPEQTPDPEPDPGQNPEPKPDPNPVTGGRPEGEYDHDAVVLAFSTGDTGGLNPKNLAIYEECGRIINELTAPDMSLWERELAVNDYIVTHAEYDPGELDSHIGSPDPDNDNPYGILFAGKGICLGYSSTFQLFMDILGIPCITVHGYAHNRADEHAWNMVQLDGEWYCVDVTWNDPVISGGTLDAETALLYYGRQYFNVTSDMLRMTDHQWDEDVPEATATARNYF